MTLYSRQPDAFDCEAEAVGAVLAAHAGVALATAREREHLQEALHSRDVIGQAKGILMIREGVDEDGAFDILRRASQRMNLKLREIAQQVVDGNRNRSD